MHSLFSFSIYYCRGRLGLRTSAGLFLYVGQVHVILMEDEIIVHEMVYARSSLLTHKRNIPADLHLNAAPETDWPPLSSIFRYNGHNLVDLSH